MVGTCEYELPTNFQNFTQKDLTEVKIFQKGKRYVNLYSALDDK